LDGRKEEGEMRTVTYLRATLVSLVLLVLAVGCAGPPQIVSGKKMPLVFQADFEDGKLDGWQPTDPAAWRIEDVNGTKVLALFGESKYRPKVRSPYNINIVRDVNVSSFVMELQMRSTRPYNPNRDLCVVFGY
jgi:hypothetical protein